MRQQLNLYLLLLAVPVVAFIVAFLLQLKSNDSGLILMQHGALLAAGIGLLLILVIKVCGVLARNNRILLAIIFTPGLYLTLLILICLILIHAALAIAIIFYIETTFTNFISSGILITIGIGAAIGILAIARGGFAMVHKARSFVVGQTLDRNDAPLFWKHIDEIADKLGALRPQHLIVGLDPNFFVSEANITCLDRRMSGRILYCSLSLCRILTKDEVTAIIGHELGHFKGFDTKYSKHFYPVYRGTQTSINALLSAGGEGLRIVAILPALVVLTYFLESFSAAERRLSRARELAADQAGVEVTNVKIMASALVKVHAFTGNWALLQKAASNGLRNGKVFANISKTFASQCTLHASTSILSNIAETHTSHPTDTHPPLSTRLESLKTTVSDVSVAALNVDPTDPAISYIPDYEKIEERIGEIFQVLLARRLGINLEQKPVDKRVS